MRQTLSLQAWYSSLTALNQPGLPNVPFVITASSMYSSISGEKRTRKSYHTLNQFLKKDKEMVP